MSEMYVVVVNIYDDQRDALTDYEMAKSLYRDWGIADTYDAAVITKNAEGKVKIVRKHEEPVRHGAGRGLVIGLAVGAVAALFPPVGLAAGLVTGGAAGAGLGATAGHVAAGMSRKDLKELGDELKKASSALLVIAAEDVSARLDEAMARGRKLARKQLRSDRKELDRALKEAEKAMV